MKKEHIENLVELKLSFLVLKLMVGCLDRSHGFRKQKVQLYLFSINFYNTLISVQRSDTKEGNSI